MKRLTRDEKFALRKLECDLVNSFSEKSLQWQDHARIAPSDWFIGPKATATGPLETALNTALNEHLNARLEYQPNDPKLRRDPTEDGLENTLTDLLQSKTKLLASYLKSSIPLASYRNQSHMYWDISTPAIVGYFAGMLYNQNNVAAEASPVTSVIEKLVGNALCELAGFNISSPAKATDAWGHITCDGSVANIEAMWAARNLKYLPIAIFEAIRKEERYHSARFFTVTTAQGLTKPLVSLTKWELLNLDVDMCIQLQSRLPNETDLTSEDVNDILNSYSIQALGVVEFTRRFLPDHHHARPLILTPQSAHYSWQKGATLLGLGFDAIQPLNVDENGRVDTKEFRKLVAQALEDQRPIIQVVGILGTTEESAVDPIDEILSIREQMRAQGLNYYLHVDGAWGGYFKTLITPEAGASDSECVSFASPYVQKQLKAIAQADSITMDPHKSGFVPYAAGSLCYRNGLIRHLVSVTSPVVHHDGQDENIGQYGIEGSKPGAAACSVFLSHDVIGLHYQGYGQLLNQCLFANKLFFVYLNQLFEQQDDLTVTVFQRLPSEKRADATEAEIHQEKVEAMTLFGHYRYDDMMTLLEKTNKTKDEQRLIEFFLALGGDLSIVNYSFNFKINGVLNQNIRLFNELNASIFKKLSLHLVDINSGEVPKAPLFLTASEFSSDGYGTALMQTYARRCGVSLAPHATLRFLISTTQNPWLTETEQGNFIPTLMEVLKTTAHQCRTELIERYKNNDLSQLIMNKD